MDAGVQQFTKFISGAITFVIPVYQRNYDWKTENCERLFNDIEYIAKKGKQHFIGTFVYTFDPAVGARQEYVIIDGQQRITSIILFAKALYDLSDDDELKADIRAKYLKHTTGKNLKNKCRLRPNEYDRATFEKILADDFDENNFSAEEKSTALYVNYRFFREKISASELSEETLCQAIDQLNIVAIMLKEENPQEIFESLNSTGLDLTKADLIRNFLLMPLQHAAQEELYKNYWLEMEKLLRPSDNTENFLVQYLIAKLKTNDAYSSKVTPNNLYNLFKKFFDQNFSDAESCLKDLLRYAKFFRRLLFDADTKFENLSALDKKFYELVYLLDAKKSPSILMYLLDRNEREPFDEVTFISFVDALISLTFRAKVCKRSGITQQFAGNMLARLDKENFLDEKIFWQAVTFGKGRYAFPNDKDFQAALISNNLYETIKSDGCRYLLYSLERAVRAKELPAYSGATVEHILPQKLNDAWREYLKARNDSQTHEIWLHTLGNLTLTAYNSELGNADFDAKKKIYADSNFSYTRALAKYPEWNSTQIQKRAKKLADAAIKVWTLPEEFNARIANLDDIFDLNSDFGLFTGTKPASVLISDKETKISAWKHLLCDVMKTLYALDRDIFRRAISIRKNLFMTESKDSTDFKLDENFYMKTVFDTKNCLRITKIIVENFDSLGDTNFKDEISFTLRRQ